MEFQNQTHKRKKEKNENDTKRRGRYLIVIWNKQQRSTDSKEKRNIASLCVFKGNEHECTVYAGYMDGQHLFHALKRKGQLLKTMYIQIYNIFII